MQRFSPKTGLKCDSSVSKILSYPQATSAFAGGIAVLVLVLLTRLCMGTIQDNIFKMRKYTINMQLVQPRLNLTQLTEQERKDRER